MSKSTDGDTRGSKRCKWTEVSSSSPFAAFERVQTLPVPDQIAVRRQAFELRFDEKGKASAGRALVLGTRRIIPRRACGLRLRVDPAPSEVFREIRPALPFFFAPAPLASLS